MTIDEDEPKQIGDVLLNVLLTDVEDLDALVAAAGGQTSTIIVKLSIVLHGNK